MKTKTNMSQIRERAMQRALCKVGVAKHFEYAGYIPDFFRAPPSLLIERYTDVVLYCLFRNGYAEE